ncbi:MAG: metal ABC transporter permease [Bacillota bacterium]|jgi:zinc transport system permease protein|nr:metal ABC transporter permease [Bacillota bacterium]HHU30601.1 metal ABC transporter permease [Bacillota bacterium]
MLRAVLQYSFLQNALFCALLISACCGIVGTIIVLKKQVMLSGGIAHISFGGIGLGYLLGIEPLIGAFLFAVAAALGISILGERSQQESDVATGIFWAAGMALGVLFIALTPGYPPDMASYLFGDILTVAKTDLLLALIIDFIVLFLVTAYYNYLSVYLFDAEFAAVLKINTKLLAGLLNVVAALTIVILVRAVGIILVMALLTAPAAVARLIGSNLKTVMLAAGAITLLSCLGGLWLSYNLHIPSGAAIALFAAAIYAGAHIIKRFRSQNS